MIFGDVDLVGKYFVDGVVVVQFEVLGVMGVDGSFNFVFDFFVCGFFGDYIDYIVDGIIVIDY